MTKPTLDECIKVIDTILECDDTYSIFNNPMDFTRQCLVVIKEELECRAWVSVKDNWKYHAYTHLGKIRDTFTPEEVALIQKFIGDLPQPPNNKDCDE